MGVVEAIVTLKCDCGHTRYIYCEDEPFEYECGFCGRKWKIYVHAEKIED